MTDKLDGPTKGSPKATTLRPTRSDTDRLFLEDLGAQIRATRQKAGVSVDELATRSGVHRTNLWKIEKGRLDVQILTLRRLAKHLNVAVEALFPSDDRLE